MAWIDELRPASFRGEHFKVDSHDASGGRRVVKHEFPLRDTPYTEDMGRRAKEFSIDAYVVGDDYMQQRDALMRACDEAGSGDLVHPYLGEVKVVCSGWALRETKAEGRMARFTLTFIESGEADFPSDDTDHSAKAWEASGAAKMTVIDFFAKAFGIEGLPSFAIEDAQNLINGAADAIGSIAKGITSIGSGQIGILGAVNNFKNSVGSLMRSPSLLAQRFYGLLDQVTSLFGSDREAVGGLMQLSGFGSDVGQINATTSTRERQQDNRDAIIGFVNQAAVIEAGRLAPSAEYETEDDANSVRDEITDALDSIMEDPSTSDDVFASLQRVRTAVVQGVPPQDQSLPNLVSVTPVITTPSLVLAYDLYEDAARGDEIVSRNRIKYPGFVPGAVPVRVLTDA